MTTKTEGKFSPFDYSSMKDESKRVYGSNPTGDVHYEPITLDLGSAVTEGGLPLEEILGSLSEKDSIYIEDADTYKSKYLQSLFNGNEDKFNQWYGDMEGLYDEVQSNRQYYGKPSLTYEEEIGLGLGSPMSGRRIAPTEEIAPEDFQWIDPKSGMPYRYLSEDQRATSKNFFVQNINGKDVKVPFNARATMPLESSKAILNFNLRHLFLSFDDPEYGFFRDRDDEGSPIWRRQRIDDKMIASPAMNVFGDQKKYGHSFWDGLAGVYSGFAPYTMQSTLQFTKLMTSDLFNLLARS